MPLRYDSPPSSGSLRQGEILRNIWEHRPLQPPIQLSQIDFTSVRHPLMIVLSPDCDLAQDFEARSFGSTGQEPDPLAGEINHPALIPHVLLCDVYEEGEIRPRLPQGREMWKRVQQNQNERYHHFPAAPIERFSDRALSDLYLDFKKMIAISTQKLYEGLNAGVERVGVVPPIYIHDLIHRFYGFHSRVGLPD